MALVQLIRMPLASRKAAILPVVRSIGRLRITAMAKTHIHRCLNSRGSNHTTVRSSTVLSQLHYVLVDNRALKLRHLFLLVTARVMLSKRPRQCGITTRPQTIVTGQRTLTRQEKTDMTLTRSMAMLRNLTHTPGTKHTLLIMKTNTSIRRYLMPRMCHHPHRHIERVIRNWLFRGHLADTVMVTQCPPIQYQSDSPMSLGTRRTHLMLAHHCPGMVSGM